MIVHRHHSSESVFASPADPDPGAGGRRVSRAAQVAVRQLIRQHALQGKPAPQLARVLTREIFAAAQLEQVLRCHYKDSPYHAIVDACLTYQT